MRKKNFYCGALLPSYLKRYGKVFIYIKDSVSEGTKKINECLKYYWTLLMILLDLYERITFSICTVTSEHR